MSVLENLSEEEAALVSILLDESGIDQAEFLWVEERNADSVFRCYDFQYGWYRSKGKLQIDQCFPEGSLVLTSEGHKPIEQVKPGDLVFTHQGNWKPVAERFDRGERDLVSVGGYGHPGLRLTPDHELYVRHRRRRKEQLPPEWLPSTAWKFEHESHHQWASPTRFPALGLPSVMDVYAPGRSNDLAHWMLEDGDFWWLCGLYIAEGSTSSSFGKGGKRNRVTFSLHEDEAAVAEMLLEALGFAFNVEKMRGKCVNVKVNSLTLASWLAQMFGTGAGEKFIHPSAFGVDEKLREEMLNGALFGDGYYRNGTDTYSTVSRVLAFDVRLLSLSLGFQASVNLAREAGEHVIEGRTVQTRDKYTVTICKGHPSRPRITFEDGLAWGRVAEPVEAGSAQCYDLAVEDDNSFVVEGIVASNCGRAVGKSLGIQMRAFAFPFTNPGEELLITAPELIHLDPVTKYIEERLVTSRLTREFLNTRGGQRGITKRPFEAKFINAARIIGRIPQKDGKGIKGMHPKKLEMDEAQDYPDAGWIELMGTLKYDQVGASWRSHGVTRGVRDYFWKLTQPDSGWEIHRITAMHRPDWSDRERHDKAEFYGGRHSPDYRRNILGLHGDSQNPLFVLTRLMSCVDTQEESEYNTSEYTHIRINDERLRETGLPIGDLIDLPARHLQYERFWIGMDVGMTNHPTEIVVMAEENKSHTGGPKKGEPDMRLKVIARLHLERISSANQRAVLERLYDFYHPKAISMDKTGLGLPIYQEIKEGDAHGLSNVLRGYNFSEKLLVGYEREFDDDGEPIEILANVLEYSSDRLRGLIDQERMRLPWDIDMLKEFQGQTYVVKHSTTNPYGKKEFNKGKFHCLDAVRMAVLGWAQHEIEKITVIEDHEPVPDIFMLV